MKSSKRLGLIFFTFLVVFLISLVRGAGCNPGFDPICNSVPTSTCDVIQNITFMSGSYSIYGIDVCSDNITINCAGAEFVSPFSSAFYGININMRKNVQLYNCTFLNYVNGIVINNSQFVQIYNNNLTDNRNNILIANSSNNIVLKNIAHSHNLFTSNYYGSAYGVLLLFTNNNTIQNNTFVGNERGIVLSSSNDNWLISNKVFNNSLQGIYINASYRSNLYGNNASRNNQEGIFILNSTISNFSFNVGSFNKASGLYIKKRNNMPDTFYLESNQFCYNRPYPPYFDILIDTTVFGGSGPIATGVNNTCQRNQNYNDSMQSGCTYLCGDPDLPPVQFLLIPNLTTQEDTPVSLDIYDYFYDPGGDYLIIDLFVSPNINITATNPNGITSFVPSYNHNGNLMLTLTVNDSTRHSAISNSFFINISPVNDPPIFISPPPAIFTYFNQSITIQLQAIDPENETFTFGTNAQSALPTPFTFNATSGYFSWNPPPITTQYVIQFNVTDGNGSSIVEVQLYVQGPLSSSLLIENFSSTSKQNTIFKWQTSSAYYDGFNHRATLGVVPIPGLPQTDIAINYSFEFADALSNHGWQMDYPGNSQSNIHTTVNQYFEGIRSLQVVGTVFQHDFNIVLSNQGRNSCMVWYDDGNTQLPSSYVGFDKVTTNTAGVFMGYQNNHPPCTTSAYCIFTQMPAVWRNSNVPRTTGWHQFCMAANVGVAPNFTWDGIKVINNTGGLDLDMISAWNNGATSHVDNVRLWSGYDASKNQLFCKNFLIQNPYDTVLMYSMSKLQAGNISYYVSNDNGQTWLPIQNTQTAIFNQSSQSFSCKIIFSQAMNSNTSPELTYLQFGFSATLPPTLTNPIPDLTWPEDTSYQINLSNYFANPQNQNLSYSLNPDFFISATFNGNIATLHPYANFSGIRYVAFTAQNTAGPTQSNFFQVNITPVNDAPELIFIPNQTVLENQTLTVQLNGTDIENNTLTYTVNSSLPNEYFLNATSGLFTWKPRFIDQGSYEVNFSVSDGYQNNSKKITITVQDVSYASFSFSGNSTIGNTMTFMLTDPTLPNTDYILAMALGDIPGIPLLDGRTIPLNPDFVFYSMLYYPTLLGYTNSFGTLNSQGQANVTWNVPYLPNAVGITVYVSYVTYNGSVPGGLIPSIALALPVVIS